MLWVGLGETKPFQTAKRTRYLAENKGLKISLLTPLPRLYGKSLKINNL